MRNPLSISSFKNTLFSALGVAVCVILLLEMASGAFSARFFYHEVDQILYDMDHHAYDSKVVVIGDSVGNQIAREMFSDSPEVALLTSNQAIETAGQYFILKRYLRKHPKPEAVIYMANISLTQNLSQSFTENYIQRCFLRWGEIAELVRTKGVFFAFKMACYKLCPTYRRQLFYQQGIRGSANRDKYTGYLVSGKGKPSGTVFGFLNIADYGMRKLFRTPPVSKQYFEKLCDLLEANEIPVYVLTLPISETTARKERFKETARSTAAFFEERGRSGEQFYYFNGSVVYPEKYFRDGRTHFNKEGLTFAAAECSKNLQRLMPASLLDPSMLRPEYRTH